MYVSKINIDMEFSVHNPVYYKSTYQLGIEGSLIGLGQNSEDIQLGTRLLSDYQSDRYI